jgi:hypothetical protein
VPTTPFPIIFVRQCHLVLGILFLYGLTSCASYTKIPEPDRGELSFAVEGELLWLTQSLYVGQFYDDDRYELLYPRRFDELTYLRSLEGEVIAPPPEQGIVPAGTRVRVEKISWPTGKTVFDRPLYTPRYATWVFLRVGRDRGQTTFERPKKHILLIPGGIPDRDTFTKWFDTYFSEDDPNTWIHYLPRDQRQGVLDKRPVTGMNYETLTAAMGYPDRITRDQKKSTAGNTTVEVAIYGAISVVLENGTVIRVSDPARKESPEVKRSASESSSPNEAEKEAEPAPEESPVESVAPAAQPPETQADSEQANDQDLLTP